MFSLVVFERKTMFVTIAYRESTHVTHLKSLTPISKGGKNENIGVFFLKSIAIQLNCWIMAHKSSQLTKEGTTMAHKNTQLTKEGSTMVFHALTWRAHQGRWWDSTLKEGPRCPVCYCMETHLITMIVYKLSRLKRTS